MAPSQPPSAPSSSPMQLQDLLRTATSIPTLSLHKLVLFIRLAQIVRPSIEINLLKVHSPPENLPSPIHHILSCAIKEGTDVVDQCWKEMKEYLWTLSPNSMQLHEEEISLFNEHALPLSLCMSFTYSTFILVSTYFFLLLLALSAYRHQYPPTRICLTPRCSNARPDGNPDHIRTLTNALTHQATLFTMWEGALRIYTTSTYCRGEYVAYLIFEPCLMPLFQDVIPSTTPTILSTANPALAHIMQVSLMLSRLLNTATWTVSS